MMKYMFCLLGKMFSNFLFTFEQKTEKTNNNYCHYNNTLIIGLIALRTTVIGVFPWRDGHYHTVKIIQNHQFAAGQLKTVAIPNLRGYD